MNGIIDVDLTAEEKLTRARVHLQKEQPFFSYLVMQLNFIEDNKMVPDTMGVDIYGNLYYNTKFVNGLTDVALKGVMCHEVMHCALEHLERGFNKNHELFNISSDAIINNIILTEGMELPKDCIRPNQNEVAIFGRRIKDLHLKTSEEVYDELYSHLGKKFKRLKKDIDKAIKKGLSGVFDKHIYGKGKKGNKEDKCDTCAGTGRCKKCNGKGTNGDGTPCKNCQGDGKCPSCKGTGNKSGKKSPNMDTKNWKKVLMDACNHAKQQGHLPGGMERIVGKLLETHIDWKGLLYRYMTAQIPVDYSWGRPHKKSFSIGTYLPNVERESIEVVLAIDTSGSISPKELTEFMGEVLSIVNSFKNVELTIIDCDCQINGVQRFKNATMDDVISRIKLRGGGGTSHIPVFNWIRKHKTNAKFIICFTDGYTSFPPKETVSIPTLWVVAGDWRAGVDKFPFGKVIELPKKN